MLFQWLSVILTLGDSGYELLLSPGDQCLQLGNSLATDITSVVFALFRLFLLWSLEVARGKLFRQLVEVSAISGAALAIVLNLLQAFSECFFCLSAVLL